MTTPDLERAIKAAAQAANAWWDTLSVTQQTRFENQQRHALLAALAALDPPSDAEMLEVTPLREDTAKALHKFRSTRDWFDLEPEERDYVRREANTTVRAFIATIRGEK